MTPTRHQRVHCPLPPTTAVSPLPVTKGHHSAWPFGGPPAALAAGRGGKHSAGRSQQPVFTLQAQVGGSHPLISAAPGQRATWGLIKSPAASTQQGPATTSGTPLHPTAPLPHSSAREPDPHRRAGLTHGHREGPHRQTRLSPEPVAPVLLPGPGRGIPCSVKANKEPPKGKAPGKGQLPPRLKHSRPAGGLRKAGRGPWPPHQGYVPSTSSGDGARLSPGGY